MLKRFRAVRGLNAGVQYWDYDTDGRGWMWINNDSIDDPELDGGWWVLRGFDEEPLHLDEFVENKLGLKVEPIVEGEQ